MPSSTIKVSVRSHVPVAVLLTSPLSGSTAYKGALPSRCSQISVRVMQPPRDEPSSVSRYSLANDKEYRGMVVVPESHFGLLMAALGEAVSAASPINVEQRLKTAAVRSVAVVVIIAICDNTFGLDVGWYICKSRRLNQGWMVRGIRGVRGGGVEVAEGGPAAPIRRVSLKYMA